MLYTMDSKTFQKLFIPLESAKTILHAQYVIVSTRIRLSSQRAEMPNAISAQCLFPDNNCLAKNHYEDAEFTYYEQLDKNKGLLSNLIYFSLKHDLNIIFLCTKNEMQLKYLEWLANYILLTYHHPVYSYKEYVSGCELVEFDKKEVLELCKKVKKETANEQREEMLQSEKGRKKVIESFGKMKKSQLIKELKRRHLYDKHLTKEEMIEVLECFPD